MKLPVASREIFVCCGKHNRSLSPDETRCCAGDGCLELSTPELCAAAGQAARSRLPSLFRSSGLPSRAWLVTLTEH